jgi:hypothetical protein
MKTRLLLAALALVALAVALSVACGPAGFESATVIDSVRILASRADHDEAYAHPGDTVTLEVAAVDGRRLKPAPMKLYWIPVACANPADDAYYSCFTGAGDGGLGGLPPDFSIHGTIDADAAATPPEDAGEDAGAVDAAVASDDAGAAPADDGGTAASSLTAALPTFTFTVPKDFPLSQPKGAPAPYGLIIVFNVACAGSLQVVPIDPSAGPQQVPLACVDGSGNALGPDDYVIGFTRVYVYQSISNKNPEVDGLVVNGAETRTGVTGTALPDPIDLDVPACGSSCPALALAVDVPASSWEVDTGASSLSGSVVHESIYVEYYAMGGSLDSEARLVYDTQAGLITGKGSTVNYTPPSTPGQTTLWAIVHDNRDGATWLQVNVHTH